MNYLNYQNQLFKWLNDNTNPHNTVIITPTSLQLVEDVYSDKTNEFIKD